MPVKMQIPKPKAKKKRYTTESRLVVATLQKAFPRAIVEAYRYMKGSIRVRILDSQFRGKDYFERDKLVTPVLQTLPESIQTQIIFLVMSTPAEHRARRWEHDYEFDHPLPLDEL